VDKDSKSLVKERSADVLYNYYRTNEFICDNTPLWRLAEILSEAFQVRIMISDPAKRDLPLSTHFKNEQLDSILSVVCATFDLRAVKNGDQIILE
jgi:ferric-dicitrate binding protein FerR (iron transport regulator)